MQEQDLQPGDVIFFENVYKKSNGEDDYSYIDHVGMFAGFDDKGYPQIIHSISSEKGHYHPDKLSGLVTTTLRALKNQRQKEQGCPDRLYDVRFLVFRSDLRGASLDAKIIAQNALDIIEGQARVRIPYDEKRLQDKLDREDAGVTDKEFKELAEHNYRCHGLYRAIKYAARLPLPMTRTRKDGVGRGITCSMAVVLAFQMAELDLLGLVKSVSTIGRSCWVSDKYAPIPQDNKFPQVYLDYLESLRDRPLRVEKSAILSRICWKGEMPPEAFTHQTFPVDAKTIGAAGLYLHMLENKKAWLPLGELLAQERVFTPEQKGQARFQRRISFFGSMELLQKTVRQYPAAISPSLSQSPKFRQRSATVGACDAADSESAFSPELSELWFNINPSA